MSGPEPGGMSRGGHNPTVSTPGTKKDAEGRRNSTAAPADVNTTKNENPKQAFSSQVTEANAAYEKSPTQKSHRRHSKRASRSSKSSQDPPVTKATLSELDVTKIVHNPKLRHDINFDPDLHFRPNLDGEKGKRKTDKANEFWNTMEKQLKLFLGDRAAFEREVGNSVWCLPATLAAIKGILETLVPQKDRAAVEQIFIVDHLMQQFEKGVANLGGLAQWLSQLLKSHCAPMRDEWVDEMVQQLSEGERNGDVALLVKGMRTLLGVLEAMKLDVANHQIRCLRPILIDDTVQFEQKFFARRIELSKFNTKPANAWFRRAKQESANSMEQSEDLWVFFNAVMDLISPTKTGSSSARPETFWFDEERFVKLRADLIDAINFEVCDHLFKDLNKHARKSAALGGTPQTPSSSSSSCVDFSSPMVPGPADFRKGAVEPELRRKLFPEALSRTPSPNSSSSGFTTPCASTPVTPFSPASRTIVTSEALHQSLLAILEDDNTEARWQLQAPSIALQVLRSTPTPLSQAPEFENCLKRHISNPDSPIFRECEASVLAQLLPMLKKVVETYVPLSSLQIFEAATTPKGAVFSTSTALNSLQDIAVRLAHIGVLHWRVWAQLAYLSPNSEDESRENAEDAEDTNMTVGEEGDPMDIDSDPRRKHAQQRQGSVTEIPTQSS